MGTVQAKSVGKEQDKTRISLENVKARVDKIHVDGIAKTKDDVVISLVRDLFQSTNFQEVILNVHGAIKKLETLNAFKHIAVLIDTSKGPGATADGLEVTFHVLEVRRIAGGVNTLVGNNEGSVVTNIRFPNTFGRGENVQAEYHYGSERSSGFKMSLSKPFFTVGNPRLNTAAFQQGAGFPWSGFRQLDRGTLLELNVESLPGIQHSFRWEGIWREIKSLDSSTAFQVREESGHSLKSAIKHIVTIDQRDHPFIANYGYLFKLQQEYAGLGGDVGFIKHEVELQLNQPLLMDMVVQGTLAGGILKRMNGKSLCICDRFFLGGPLSLRGFTFGGVGPHASENALGAETYWASGLHLYTPLPFRPAKDSIGHYFRTHFFVNIGNIGNFSSEDNYIDWKQVFSGLRCSCGAGVVLSVGQFARFELNYCLPLQTQSQDRTKAGMQFGIGVSFL